MIDDSRRSVVWHFEEERELIDIVSLFTLLPRSWDVDLHIPYLPYARQDKAIGNDKTFNLFVLAKILNSVDIGRISAVDVHNQAETRRLIPKLVNCDVTMIHEEVVANFEPRFIVFPDAGARYRYASAPFRDRIRLAFDKTRDQATGQLVLGSMSAKTPLEDSVRDADLYQLARPGDRFLIIDDICDGGATFIEVAKRIREKAANAYITLFVTHGLFSRGRAHLLNNGIDAIFTTNSLRRNEHEYAV